MSHTNKLFGLFYVDLFLLEFTTQEGYLDVHLVNLEVMYCCYGDQHSNKHDSCHRRIGIKIVKYFLLLKPLGYKLSLVLIYLHFRIHISLTPYYLMRDVSFPCVIFHYEFYIIIYNFLQ